MNAQFEVGKTYTCRSICDHDCIFSFEVTKRTAQNVWLKDSGGKIKRRKVRVTLGVETVDPHGRYSMSPVLRAQ